ncbi:MAG: peptidoglycan DD-metalloendopeptidase family protein [Hyphomonadaceae bacterium]|nr:peptidoglycan DD-metalloendopeptidase family protein [Hyphomonadaceae bacterium]
MSSSKRKRTPAPGVSGPIARTLIIAVAVSAAGCSAEVTRFDFSGSSRTTTSSIPVPPEPVRSGYAPSAPPRGLGLTEAPLPPAPEPHGDYRTAGRPYDAPPAAPALAERQPPSEPPGNYRVVGRQYKTPPASPFAESPPQMAAGPRPSAHQPPPSDIGAGSIDVQPGETLYSIGRRTGVSVAAIKDANGLSSDSVRPGQRLAMPAGAQERSPFAASSADRTPAAKYIGPPAQDRTAALTAAPRHTAQPAVEAPPGWEGRYTMKNGDSLYGIALRHRVTLEELKRANGITDPTKVWAGTVLNVPGLNVPGQSDAAASGPATPPRVAHTPPRIINAAPEPTAPDQRMASRGDIANDAEPPEVAAKFRWPVRGKVIAGFGRRPDGTHNDGVNVAVPHGTEIYAADAGKVAYAGNELKGYGNLVLIRHANGWVTAYAHADQLLVRPNDEVRRGQVIARAGRTGAVDQPQLHFELRQGSRPVDPMPHLAN